MKKITYSKIGDFCFPNLQFNKYYTLTKWSRAKLTYMKEHEHGHYLSLLFQDKLEQYLQEIDIQANQMYEHLIAQFKRQYNITEELKQSNQLFWLQQMNMINNIVEEIVLNELIQK